MSIALKEPELVTRIEQFAATETRQAEDIVAQAVRAYLDDREREAIHDETETFLAMHADLWAKYPGQHIALYRGQVADHDTNVMELERRIRAKFGQLPVLIAPVSERPRRELMWRGGHVEAVML
ncbi:MAG: hypothetical protein JXA33_07260 [Anaerolineae bacterium]|nr:hypothetical protein [Anaerolineae bacterium]